MTSPKILIIGYGSIGRRHSQVLECLKCDVAFLRSNKGNLAKSTDTSNFKVFYSLPHAIDMFEPSYIVDCSPSSFHLSNLITAHSSSIPILSEKPFLTSLLDASNQAYLSAILNSGYKCGVSFQYRFHPTINFLLDYLNSNNLFSSVKYVSVRWREYLPSWHSWENYRDSYASSKLLGGGSLLTMCHPHDYVEYLFGSYSIVNVARPPITLDIDVNDSSLSLINFLSGITATIYLDFSSLINEHILSVYLTDMTIHADLNSGLISMNSVDDCQTINTDYFSRDKLFSDMHIEFQSWLFNDLPFRSRLVDHAQLAYQLVTQSSAL
jgi:CMP-N,N'-diacetyllegionaminic acid synthase